MIGTRGAKTPVERFQGHRYGNRMQMHAKEDVLELLQKQLLCCLLDTSLLLFIEH